MTIYPSKKNQIARTAICEMFLFKVGQYSFSSIIQNVICNSYKCCKSSVSFLTIISIANILPFSNFCFRLKNTAHDFYLYSGNIQFIDKIN